MVYLECNLCRCAAVEPVLNRCGHLFCGPCLRDEFRRHRGRACRCPACGRLASPSRLTPIYGQEACSEPPGGDDSGDGCGLDGGCAAPGCAGVDMMDIDGPSRADYMVTMEVYAGCEDAGVDPMEVDDWGDQAGEGKGADGGTEEEAAATTTKKKKMAHLECHICLGNAEEPVATPCGHVYCCPCLFQWLDGRRRKCPMCKESVSESTVTLVRAAPGRRGGTERSESAVPAMPRAHKYNGGLRACFRA